MRWVIETNYIWNIVYFRHKVKILETKSKGKTENHSQIEIQNHQMSMLNQLNSVSIRNVNDSESHQIMIHTPNGKINHSKIIDPHNYKIKENTKYEISIVVYIDLKSRTHIYSLFIIFFSFSLNLSTIIILKLSGFVHKWMHSSLLHDSYATE